MIALFGINPWLLASAVVLFVAVTTWALVIEPRYERRRRR